MNIKRGIETRRAYRSLDPVEITETLIRDLSRHAGLAPSCFNKQPWRFVFAYDREVRQKVFDTLSETNRWVRNASLIIAVFSRKDFGCLIKEREYFLFDSGMASAFLILRATELGLVAHPIAGYDENRVKEVLKIPGEMRVITLIIVGRKSNRIHPELTRQQSEIEKKRPLRLEFGHFAWMNHYEPD